MTTYVIAQISITDPGPYRRYQERFMDVLKRFGGRLLAYDERPSVEEGSWDHDRVVLLSFPDNVTFRAWADSPDYREIAADRRAGSNGVVLAVQGLSHEGTLPVVERPEGPLHGNQSTVDAARQDPPDTT